MARNYAKKCRICRASGEKLFLKGERCFSAKCPITRRGAVPPGQHGAKRKRRGSDYLVRLKETNKLKNVYGITERELKKYFGQARKVAETTGEALLQILESRLDNLVYRLGFSPSRRLARQLVGHKHVFVNGKIVNIPSYRAKEGQVISLDSKAMGISVTRKLLDDKEFVLPEWLERKAAAGKFSKMPKRGQITTNINEQYVVEYYSRR
jgi:small subunit ribosomal protein S4